MARVSIRNVSNTCLGEKAREVAAVNNVSIEIEEREFVALLGPLGCGNSTLLRMIAGLEAISQGDIYIGDKRVNDLTPKDREIALVFQDYALYPHMSVYDNVSFGLKLRKFPEREIKRRVTDAASILGIEELLDRKPKSLSGAQRQRVAVARAVVRQAKVFLVDAPLSNFDARMRSEIVKLHQRLHATMIYATHDPLEAMTIADRIIIMNEGLVQQNDAPLRLYNEPANLFVAGFLGSPPMNFISGTLRDEGEKIRFRELDGGTIDIAFSASERPAARAFVGKNVILGIRPEDLEVAQFSRKEGRATGTGFPALVDLVQPMGAETILHLETGAHTIVCRSEKAFDHREAGHRLQFEINLAKAHLFDAESSTRLR